MQTLGNLWFIPSNYLEAAHNYSEEKVITVKKITPTTVINKTAKTLLIKLFPLFQKQYLLTE